MASRVFAHLWGGAGQEGLSECGDVAFFLVNVPKRCFQQKQRAD